MAIRKSFCLLPFVLQLYQKKLDFKLAFDGSVSFLCGGSFFLKPDTSEIFLAKETPGPKMYFDKKPVQSERFLVLVGITP